MMLGIVPYQPAELSTVAPVIQKPATTWDWYRQVRALEANPLETPVQSAVTGLRHNAEAGLVGALLGVISGEFGLDVRGKYPIDAIIAALCYAASVSKAGDTQGFASDIREIGQTCTAVYSFRTAERWRERLKESKGQTIPGNTFSQPQNSGSFVDPIIEAGKLAGL